MWWKVVESESTIPNDKLVADANEQNVANSFQFSFVFFLYDLLFGGISHFSVFYDFLSFASFSSSIYVDEIKTWIVCVCNETEEYQSKTVLCQGL